MSTLLDKAKAAATVYTRLSKKPSKEELALALAFLSGEVSPLQTAIAIGKDKGNHSVAVVYWAWSVLRESLAHHIISIKVVR